MLLRLSTKILRSPNTSSFSPQIKMIPHSARQIRHIVAKLLFLCKMSQPDIQTADAFLTTRVKRPGQDDLKA